MKKSEGFFEICERSSELYSETVYYYYGARYYNPRVSLWLNVDPLAGYNSFYNSEHYIDGEHNGGVYNSGNLNPYIYTYQNPIKYVDPNGKQVDALKAYLGNLWNDWSPWSRAGSRMSGESERDQNNRLALSTMKNVNGAAKAAATKEVGHFALDAIGTIEPTPIADTANAIWYVFEGDYKNAAFSGISIVPYLGDEIGKGAKYGGKLITQIQKHHIIPQQLYKIMPEIGEFIMKNSGLNLKKLPNRFHGNHPAYTKWILKQIKELAGSNFTKEGLEGVIKEANQEINKAYQEFKKTGQSLIILKIKSSSNGA